MARTSNDEYDADGYVLNGYDYILQVWVQRGVIQPCSHPPHPGRAPCCNADALKGMSIRTARASISE